MGRFGNPVATAGASATHNGRAGERNSPPAGQAWAWLTANMLSSLAWRSLSTNGRRLIDFLLVEHCNHAGTKNGELIATHTQLREYGLTADRIRPAIEECQMLGLIEYRRGGRWAKTNRPSTYRLTFYEDCYGNPATNEWQGVSKGLDATGNADEDNVASPPRRPRRRSTNSFAAASLM